MKLSEFKLTAAPFVFGAWCTGFFTGDYGFAISSTIIFSVLLLTKQAKLI